MPPQCCRHVKSIGISNVNAAQLRELLQKAGGRVFADVSSLLASAFSAVGRYDWRSARSVVTGTCAYSHILQSTVAVGYAVGLVAGIYLECKPIC
jgi:hypothetical protein